MHLRNLTLLEIGETIGVRGFLHSSELMALIEMSAGRDVMELGAFCGLSAWGMAITAKHVTSIDTFSAATDGQRQTRELTTLEAYKQATARFNNVTFVVATSEIAARDPYCGVAQTTDAPPSEFDFIFIDATHTYEELKLDIQRWWPKLRSGGVMAFHDYKHDNYPGVQQAVDEIFGPAPEGTTIVTLRWVIKP